MTVQPAILFETVSKRFDYTAGQPQTILESAVAAVTRRRRQTRQTLWAVDDIDFQVMSGESLGIIGRNGSGKSTILKLAAGIIRPTTGRVLIRGRLSALLELGAGFHPDLTGRENIFLNGSILGMNKNDMDRFYEAIVEFSELGEFINMPVKHYSSGMYMRLGFSVAVHVNPDVLIIDEILAVGDQAFQNKCIDRIFDLKRRGVTIIIVSHNLETVRSLCSHLIWVENGHLRAAGPADEIVDQYLESQEGWQTRRDADGNVIFRRWGSYDIELTQVRLLNSAGEERDRFPVGEALTVEMHYQAHRPVQDPVFGLAFFLRNGTYISGPDNQLAGLPLGTLVGSGVLRYHIDQLPLSPAVYRLTAAIYDTEGAKPYDHHDKAYTFRVLADGRHKRKGLFEIPARWEWQSSTTPVVVAASFSEVNK
jgi:lipopolysaccharide transport system ATP-binding protein